MGNKKNIFSNNNPAGNGGENERQDSSSLSQSTEKAVCTQCHQEKSQTKENFYFRKNRNKFETICIECKKQNQQELRDSSKVDRQVVEEKLPNESLTERATKSSFPRIDDSDRNEVFKVFNLLRQWRDELKKEKPDQLKTEWKEITYGQDDSKTKK